MLVEVGELTVVKIDSTPVGTTSVTTEVMDMVVVMSIDDSVESVAEDKSWLEEVLLEDGGAIVPLVGMGNIGFSGSVTIKVVGSGVTVTVIDVMPELVIRQVSSVHVCVEVVVCVTVCTGLDWVSTEVL